MFFDVLKQECDKKGIAVSTLLESVKMSKGNVSRWRRGEEPKPASKLLLANALGVDPSIFEHNEKPATTEDDRLDAEILERINRLDESRKEDAIKYLDFLISQGKQ